MASVMMPSTSRLTMTRWSARPNRQGLERRLGSDIPNQSEAVANAERRDPAERRRHAHVRTGCPARGLARGSQARAQAGHEGIEEIAILSRAGTSYPLDLVDRQPAAVPFQAISLLNRAVDFRRRSSDRVAVRTHRAAACVRLRVRLRLARRRALVEDLVELEVRQVDRQTIERKAFIPTWSRVDSRLPFLYQVCEGNCAPRP